jgi:hypothetical protein
MSKPVRPATRPPIAPAPDAAAGHGLDDTACNHGNDRQHLYRQVSPDDSRRPMRLPGTVRLRTIQRQWPMSVTAR